MVSTLGDARSFFGLASKMPPLVAMLNFDADVKKRSRVTHVKTTIVRMSGGNREFLHVKSVSV